MDTVAAYHFGWIDAEGRLADGDGGKAVRPALALLSAEAAGRRPRPVSPAPSPWNWCTTSRCCTTT